LNAVLYINEKVEDKNRPFLITGGLTGGLTIFDINKQRVCYTDSEVVSKHEIVHIIRLEKKNQIVLINADQNMIVYNLIRKINKKG
jgi:hypothetical protein